MASSLTPVGSALRPEPVSTNPVAQPPRRAHRFPIVVTVVVSVSGFVMVFPFLWEFLTSLKTLGESTSVPPVIFPGVWRWHNYERVFEAIPFAQQFLNTVLITIGRVAGQLLFCSLAGYA